MAEVVELVGEISRGGQFQLLEAGVPGEPFTADIAVYRITDDVEPTVLKTRITFDVDALTLTFEAANTALLIDALNSVVTTVPPPE